MAGWLGWLAGPKLAELYGWLGWREGATRGSDGRTDGHDVYASELGSLRARQAVWLAGWLGWLAGLAGWAGYAEWRAG